MKWLFTALLLGIVGSVTLAQKPITGIFEYKATVTLPDTNLVIKSWNVKVLTNDTIVRVETETNLGTQIYIRHMSLNKAYLLIVYGDEKYAIQNDLSKKAASDTVKAPQYTIKRKWGSKTVAGVKARKYYVKDAGSPDGYYCYFAKHIPGKYLEVYPESEGLAVDYYLPSPDGLIHYELVKYTPTAVSRDLFGIPSDYKRVSFDEFIQRFTGE